MTLILRIQFEGARRRVAVALTALLTCMVVAVPAAGQTSADASISGVFHFDEDGSSIGRTDTNRLAGVQVTLLKATQEAPNRASREEVGAVTTGDDGAYRFDGLEGGQYVLRWVLPTGIVSDESTHRIDLPGGSVERVGPTGLSVVLDDGGTLEWDIPTTPANVIEIDHFWDTNLDGQESDDDVELDASLVRVTATRLHDGEQWVSRPDPDDRRQGLVIPDLPAGEYELHLTVEGAPSSFLPTIPRDAPLASPSISLDAAGRATVELFTVGETRYLHAGYARSTRLTGEVFVDLDGDGVFNGDEPLADGVTATLSSPDHPLGVDGVLARAATSTYSFEVIEGFSYRVAFTTPAPLPGFDAMVPTTRLEPAADGRSVSVIDETGTTALYTLAAPIDGAAESALPHLSAGFRPVALPAVEDVTAETPTLPATGTSAIALASLSALSLLLGRRLVHRPR